MGAFVSNVQVFTGDGGTSRADVVRALREDDGAFEGPVAVGPQRAEPWIALFGPVGTEPDLARAVSQACACTCVSVTVHDSDLLRLELIVAGQALDVFNSMPEEFPEPDGSSGEGDAARWMPVLASGRTPLELAAAWGSEELFAEDLLLQVADVLGMHAGDAMNGQDLYTGELLQPVEDGEVDWLG
ncbi:MAG: hypothetical protein JXA36_03730 [Coriobacteriia bacterium]|nr:hypothetical protein [Coriobacteriia bacterium]